MTLFATLGSIVAPKNFKKKSKKEEQTTGRDYRQEPFSKKTGTAQQMAPGIGCRLAASRNKSKITFPSSSSGNSIRVFFRHKKEQKRTKTRIRF